MKEEKGIGSDFDERLKDFEEEIESLGKRVERKVEDAEKRFKQKYEPKFGLLNPLLWGLVGLLLLSLVILGLDAIGGRIDSVIPTEFGIFLADNLALLFGLMLFFNYSTYFSKKYPQTFRYLSPFTNAVGIIVMLWILANMFLILNLEMNLTMIERAANFVIDNLQTIFIVAVLLGFLFLLVQKQKESGKDKKLYMNSKGRDYNMNRDGNKKRLYRSSKDKLIGGLCGGIAEYFDIDPVLVRIIWAIFAFASLGTAVLIYIILWIVVPRNPEHHWD
ncbi:MAG: PspC domain-containing protein [Candidatus Saliniplasma sp.]